MKAIPEYHALVIDKSDSEQDYYSDSDYNITTRKKKNLELSRIWSIINIFIMFFFNTS